MGFSLRTIVITLVCALLLVGFSNARKVTSTDILDSPVCDLDLEADNLPLALSKIAYKYDVPIGLEVAIDDDLLDPRIMSVQVRQGTMRDVLTALLKQKPQYQWAVNDGAIDVFPKDKHRDESLKTLLETRVQIFTVPQSISRINFREAVTRTPEVKGFLAAKNIKHEPQIFGSDDLRALGPDFSLKLSNSTVRSILNSAIRESPRKYWIVNRYGPKRKYLLLNL